MDEAKIREFCKVFRDEHSLAAEYARSDGHRDWWSGGTWLYRGDVILELGADDLLQFARNLLAAEREECAKVCDGMKIKQAFKTNRVGAVESGWNDALYEAAKAIRKGAPHA